MESSENTLSLRSHSKVGLFSIVIGVLAFMPIILDISGNFVSLQATATFDTRLMALTPLIPHTPDEAIICSVDAAIQLT